MAATNHVHKGSIRPSGFTDAMTVINQREATAQHRRLLRKLGDELRQAREDAGRSQREVARAAGIAQAHLSAIEAGGAEPSLEVLGRLGAVLGLDLSVRYFANTGPRIRDHIQAVIEQAAIEASHVRWRPDLEVPVSTPVRGVIDAVLHDRTSPDSLATEIQSQILRVEQQLRWAREKADALAALPEFAGRRVRRLLLLRNSAANRALLRSLPQVLAAAYPGRAVDAVQALTESTAPFPGAAIVWVDVEHGVGRLRSSPPRVVPVGR